MALRDQPYIPLYVQDFMTDEKLNECSAESTGVYIRIMCLMHKSQEYGTILLQQKYQQNDSNIKNFAYKLQRHMPYDVATIERALHELVNEEVLHLDNNVLSQKRMVKDGELSLIRANAGKKGGQKTSAQAKQAANGVANIPANNVAKSVAKSVASTENEYEYEIEVESEDGIEDGIEDESLKKKKPIRKKYGQYGRVLLTDEEHARLLKDLGNEELSRCIQYIDESAQSTGNKNGWKDWNLVLRRCSKQKWGLGYNARAAPTKISANKEYEQEDWHGQQR